MAEREEGALTAVEIAGPEAAAAIMAEWEEGRAVLPLDPRATRTERRQIVDALRPTHLHGEWGVRALPGGVPITTDVAAVVTTSATAGPPKGVELTWAGLAASAEASRRFLSPAEPRTGDGGWLCCLPLNRVGGLGVLGRSWSAEVPVEVTARFEPGAVAESAASFVSLVPTTLRRCLDEGVDLAHFDRILVGGAPLDPDLRARAEHSGAAIVATYGLTETWGGIVYDGVAIEGVELRLGDDDEILVRGPMVMRGYRLSPDDTAACLSSDGWLRTGDVGLRENGLLSVVDRLRDIVVSGGVNVSPSEVESVLADHPKVADVGVAGAPDPEWGERVVAHVVATDPADPPTLAELRAFAGERLSVAKLPREVALIAEVPRSAGGKTLRRLLACSKPGQGGYDPSP